MKTKHTPGNWHAKDGQIYPEETGVTLAIIPYFDKDNEEHQANSRLIEAAPKIFKALQEIISWFKKEMGDIEPPEVTEAIDLINEVNKIIENKIYVSDVIKIIDIDQHCVSLETRNYLERHFVSSYRDSSGCDEDLVSISFGEDMINCKSSHPSMYKELYQLSQLAEKHDAAYIRFLKI